MKSRRSCLLGAGALLGAPTVSRAALAGLPDLHLQSGAASAPPLSPSAGPPYRPVVTLNGWSLPFRMRNGWKEFHLVAEPVERELAPGMVARLWGYNGQSPGPTIEVVEGDRVRIFVTNRLPEHTSIHWHGQRLPNGMDGVSGLTQAPIPPGKTYVYEFVARRPGTFMYHPHADEMTQMAMGMMGLWVTHPRDSHPHIAEVDRDFCFLLAAFDVRQGDRVRIRIGNLSMTSHHIHLHGHEFEVTGTDGGPVPRSARWPEVTTDVAVGQMRQIELVADAEGDWAFHCHKSHHTMNAMGHNVPTMIGVDHRGLVDKIQKLVPDYMLMGERGMADMGEMEMPLPDNTLPMMTGQGPFGAVEMGGMFTVLKVRRGKKRGDSGDPGWFRHPKGTVAYEWAGAGLPEPARSDAAGRSSMPRTETGQSIEM